MQLDEQHRPCGHPLSLAPRGRCRTGRRRRRRTRTECKRWQAARARAARGQPLQCPCGRTDRPTNSRIHHAATRLHPTGTLCIPKAWPAATSPTDLPVRQPNEWLPTTAMKRAYPGARFPLPGPPCHRPLEGARPRPRPRPGPRPRRPPALQRPAGTAVPPTRYRPWRPPPPPPSQPPPPPPPWQPPAAPRLLKAASRLLRTAAQCRRQEAG
mmetsp:Transcript_71778/g.202748  ORF Transcript_71778/g.202748 Transcript_71778/m.202748 type:complete len:212 (-) Transcript_71778:55-690(-)